MATTGTFTPAVKAVFLQVLADTGNVSVACRLCCISRDTAYGHRGTDPAFAVSWEEAKAIAADSLEAEARRRGVDGVNKPVYYKGELVDTNKQYSDLLLVCLLNANKPEKFGRAAGHKLQPDAGDDVEDFFFEDVEGVENG